MTSEERRIVEDGYRAGTLLILVATSTVAAGVNLPAKRVILRSLRQVRFNKYLLPMPIFCQINCVDAISCLKASIRLCWGSCYVSQA